ncbi:MAG: hypothetical protein AMXMBFR82_34570 [Candidatus Hydrogenedentota bacterium]
MAQDCIQKSRAGKPLSFMAGAALTVLASACGPAKAPEKPVEAVAPVAQAAEVHLVPASPIDFSDRSGKPEFQNALGQLSSELGLRFSPMEAIGGAYQATASHESAEENLLAWHQAALKHGAFLFRVECHFGIGTQPDVIAVLPTTDQYEVIQAVGTDGVNFDVDNAEVIVWLRGMEEQNPFTLTGAGQDFLEGYFVTPPENAPALAKRMYDFCPDIVDQGTGTVEALAGELKHGKLYLWWD